MTSGPYVLIIIPTYNRAHLLPEALESALKQDYPFKKIVIVDDGSTDATRQLCEQYIARYSGIIVYKHQQNAGCSTARNRGLETIDDEIGYVCFLDSDDRLLDGKLTREVAILESHPEAGFTYADSIVYDEVAGIESVHAVAAAGDPDAFAIEHFLTNEAKPAALLYRAELVRNKRFREDLLYNEDSEFLQRIALEHKGVYSAQPGCWVRWHSNSKSRNVLEILKAVVRANQDAIDAYPIFYQAFKERIDARMKQARRQAAVEMLLAQRWTEVPEYSSSLFLRIQARLRCAAYYRISRKVRLLMSARYKMRTE